MPTKTIDVADALDAPIYAYGHRPAGNPSDIVEPLSAVGLSSGHRPALDFASDPASPTPPSVIEHFIMNAQRVDSSHVTWVTTAPDPTGAAAPAGASIVTASIVLVKRGLFY